MLNTAIDVFSFFKGQASSVKTKGIGGLVTHCADIGCQFIEREEKKRSGGQKPEQGSS